MTRLLILAFTIVTLSVLTGCGSDVPTALADRNRTRETGTVGTLEGTIQIGPNCPVEQVGKPCPPPASVWQTHFVVIADLSGNRVRQMPADSSGGFRTELPAGTYVVDFIPHDIGMRQGSIAQQVTIQAGQTATVTIRIDTGIR